MVEGVRPVPSLTGLSVPIVGQFYKSGAEQTLRMMEEGEQLYLHPEPTNPYDRNAQKVVVFRNGALKHLGYVQRHFALKIADAKTETLGGKVEAEKLSLVGTLRKKSFEGNQYYEVVIGGVISNIRDHAEAKAKIGRSGGLFDEPPRVGTKVKKVIVDPHTFVSREYEFFDEDAERDWDSLVDTNDFY